MATKATKPPAGTGWGDGPPVDANQISPAVFPVEDRVAALEAEVSKQKKAIAHLLERAGIEPDDPRLG